MAKVSEKDRYTKLSEEIDRTLPWSDDPDTNIALWRDAVTERLESLAANGNDAASRAVDTLSAAPETEYRDACAEFVHQMTLHGNAYVALRAARGTTGLLKPVRGPRSVQTNSVPTTDYAHKAWSWLTARKNRKH